MKNYDEGVKIDGIAEEHQDSQSAIAALAEECAMELDRNPVPITHHPNNKHGSSFVGKNVKTTYGLGIVLEYRERDGMYVIKLTSEVSFATMAMLYTQHVPTPFKTRSDEIDELNVAYEALETMRRLNLEVMCSEAGICQELDYCMCTTCLLSQGTRDKSHFPRLQKLMDSVASTDLQSLPLQHFRLFQSSVRHETITAPPADSGDMNDQMSRSPAMQADQNAGDTTASDEEAQASPADSLDAEKSPSGAHGCTETTGEAHMNVRENDSKPLVLAPSSEHSPKPEKISASAAASSSSPPADADISSSFPRLWELWGSIPNIPHPAAPLSAAKSTSPDGTTQASVRNPGSQQSSVQSSSTLARETTQTAPAAKSAVNFSRVRGLLKSSTAASSLLGSMTHSIDSLRMIAQCQPFEQIPDPQPNNKLSSTSASPTNAATEKPTALPRIQKLMDQRQKANTFPCLVCASPCCASHSSSSFRREGITLCLSCERLFELNFIVDCVTAPDPAERTEHILRMIDCYDRCMLLLHYSSQFGEELAGSLEEQQGKQDKIGLASSSAGILSGMLGIAAAASILTPAGPSLLIASLFFGGGATTVQTGSEAMSYYSEPRKLADRIIALHGMALSILRVTSTLRDAMLRDHIRTDVYEAEPAPLSSKVKEKLGKNKGVVMAGTNVGRTLTLGSVAGAEVGAGGAAAGAGAARSATAFSRAGTAAARTVRFARFAGGALSAAVLVMEANSLKTTLKSIDEGSPCEKADTLRRVLQEIKDFPTSGELDDECQSYLAVLASRPPAVSEMTAVPDNSTSQNLPEATCEVAPAGAYFAGRRLCAPGMEVVDGDPSDIGGTNLNEAGAASQGLATFGSTASNSVSLGSFSLLQRVHWRQTFAASSTVEEAVAVAVVDDDHLRESEMNLVI